MEIRSAQFARSTERIRSTKRRPLQNEKIAQSHSHSGRYYVGGRRRSAHYETGAGISPAHCGAPHARRHVDVRLPHGNESDPVLLVLLVDIGRYSIDVGRGIDVCTRVQRADLALVCRTHIVVTYGTLHLIGTREGERRPTDDSPQRQFLITVHLS